MNSATPPPPPPTVPAPADATKTLTEGVSTVVLRLVEFFDIFDLSFVISGIASSAAIAFLVTTSGYTHVLEKLTLSWQSIVPLTIAAYCAGLTCFASGRFLRRKLENRNRMARLKNLFQVHGLDAAPEIQALVANPHVTDSNLYVRLWTAMRQTQKGKASYSLLSRYWVMSATCDGLAVAWLLWAAVLGFLTYVPNLPVPLLAPVSVGLIPLLLVASAVCWREASRYDDYQVEELVASLAEIRRPTVP
jgi:hypothetical protein